MDNQIFLNERNFNQGYNVGAPIPLSSKQLKYLAIPKVVSRAFLFMFAALLITAFAAFNTSYETMVKLVASNSFYFVVIAELVVVLISNYAISKNIPVLAGIMYVVYSYLTGMLISVIFLMYSMSSIFTVFLTTAIVFAVMAVYGMITKADLTSVGNICFMGLVGIVIASVVNIFILQSSRIDLLISCIGVLIFVALTAYDVQKIKARALSATDQSTTTLALFSGFELYLDFVNLFLSILRISGSRD